MQSSCLCSFHLGLTVCTSVLSVCLSARLPIRLSVLLSARLSAHLLLSLSLSLTRLCLCHFQLKCRPRPIKFLAKFIRDFCPHCRCPVYHNQWQLLLVSCSSLYYNLLFLFALLYVYSAAIQAIAAYLDAFQKIADAATNSRGKFKSRKHTKKHTKRNETLPPPPAAPRNCRNCARTVRNIRYISYIHLLFMRLPSNVDGDSDVSVNVGHRSDFTHFTPISTRSSRVE